MEVQVVAATDRPQTVVYLAMHQDYSAFFVLDRLKNTPSEEKCGDIIVKSLLKGDRGHYGCLEHVSITLGCKGIPHSVVQQATRHRLASFDVQSFRYTSNSVLNVTNGLSDLDDAFYFRPVGSYFDRQGKRYSYTEESLQRDREYCLNACHRYAKAINDGMVEEHARDFLPFNYRQHFFMTMNLRSIMHFLDLRYKKDAQIEIQTLCSLIWPHIQAWTPQLATWYEQSRLGKARLAP